MITVYVGDVTEYLGLEALKQDPSAKLIDNSNYSNLTNGTYYASIGDLDNLTQFSEVLRQASNIIYTPPAKWSDEVNGKSKMKEWTEDYLLFFSDKNKISNFNVKLADDKDTMLRLIDNRKSEEPQIWVAGCSVTYGTGISKNQRYGQLIADSLKLPVSFLAEPASSLTWQADQILRSDIRKGDIVIWGLTAIERFPYFKNNNVKHVLAGTYIREPKFKDKVDISFLDSQQLIYQAILEIHQVINFCNKIGIQLILAHLLGDGLEAYLHGYNNYLMLYKQYGRDLDQLFIDLGDDNQHPGPLTHQWYASEILKKLKL